MQLSLWLVHRRCGRRWDSRDIYPYNGPPPHEQWFMNNWIFIALYMTVFVGATSLHERATGYNRRINEDYSHNIWAGVYDDFFRKLREEHEREVE